jgi:hypothetical protein
MAKHYVSNIKKVFNQATADDIAEGKRWYKEAMGSSQRIADAHELPLAVVVGVVAALSPTNRWDRNIIDADLLCGAFARGGYMEDVNVCTYKTMKAKAWSILGAGTSGEGADRDAIATLLNGPKITDFYWCILGDATRCVIDGHAWCIANGDRRTMQEVPNIGKGLRLELQAAYVKAGKANNLTAYEMQATTWVVWRRQHGIN